MADTQARPIIEPRAATGLLTGVKAQGVDQVQRAAGRDAGAADVARVVGDFGFMENHVKDRRPGPREAAGDQNAGFPRAVGRIRR